MHYPDFFNDIETIKLQDKLSDFLGTFEDGIVEFSYLDIVKSAGHSCPTVAGAYIITKEALKYLYKDEIPKRGEILVSFKDDSSIGTTGVIANVITQITGATDSYGFKGLNNQFKRYNLMQFNDKNTINIKFQRLDTNQTVQIDYNHTTINMDPRIPDLMQKLFNNIATKEEKTLFGKLWQKKVEDIFNNLNKVLTIYN